MANQSISSACLTALILIGSMFSGAVPLSAQSSLPTFERAAASMMAHPDMAPAQVGISVIDVQSGQVLYAYQDNKSMVTGSTLKALTTATALSVLGPDFRFETRLVASGPVRNGVLEGDLIILGSGDPTLGSDRLRPQDGLDQLMYDWAQILKNQGIREIRGSVIGDDSRYSSQLTPGNWGWEDMGNYYGAGASALNIAENTYRLDFSSSAPGSASTILRTDPEMPIFFINEVVAGPNGSGDNAYIYGAPYTQIRYVRGSIPPYKSLFSIKGSIPDPALFCAKSLEESLKSCGVTVSGPASTFRLRALSGKRQATSVSTLHTHRSAPLSQITQMTNYFSINLYAEALVKEVAAHQGEVATSGDGAAVMKGYWTSRGVSAKGLHPRDGSGLSANNLVTPAQFTGVLRKVDRGNVGVAFRESLPVAGRSGALKNKMRGTAAEGRVRAKSGYISGVRGYVGYVDLPDGRQLAFAFMANYFDGSVGAMSRRWEGLMVKLAEGR